MIALLATLALAEPLPTLSVDPSDAVRSVQHVAHLSLDAPATYTMAGDRPVYSEATLFVAQVDPALLAVRQGPAPVLYAGVRPARILHRSPEGCVVGFVPGDLTGAPLHLFFGSDTLPERVDAESGVAEAETARAAGAPLHQPETTGLPASLAGQDALFALGASANSHCSAGTQPR